MQCSTSASMTQVSHDDKGNTSVAFLEATDVSQPARVQQVTCQSPSAGPGLELYRRWSLLLFKHCAVYPTNPFCHNNAGTQTVLINAGLWQLLDRAMRQRSVGATAMNEQSSRSHMVFMLQLRGTNELSGQRVSGAQASRRRCQ